MIEFALIDPIPTYTVEMPESYAEARTRMRDAGELFVMTIEQQSDQTTVAEILTAQILNDLGEGWRTVFKLATNDPSSAGAEEMRFQWQPGGNLTLAFPDEMSTEFCQSGVYPLIKAGKWRDMMDTLRGWEYMGEVVGDFAIELEDILDEQALNLMGDQIEIAALDVFDLMLETEGSSKPMFDSLTIDWGSDAAACLSSLYELRQSRN